MTLRTRWLTLPAAALAATGCRSTTCCNKVSRPPLVAAATLPPAAYAPRPGMAEVLPPAAPPVVPLQPAPVVAPPPAPAAPPPSFPPSPSNFAPPPPSFPPSPSPSPSPSSPSPSPSTFAPPPSTIAPPPAPVEPPPARATPVAPIAPDAPAKLLDPEFGEAATAEPPLAKPDAASPVKPAPPPTPAPTESKSQTPATLPVDIANFESALEGRVTAGRKPAIDGLNWLKANGTKTALLLRGPSEVDDGDRKLFTERGIKFFSLDVSAAGLTKAKSDEFNRLVADSANHPLFVYDADGSLAGPLWYLYFRRAEGLGDEAARVRAERLGLKTDAATGERAALWQAVQRLLK